MGELVHNKLILTIGLPYSGKSTWAQTEAYPIVCPDAIRLATHGARFIPQTEPLIWPMSKIMVRSLFYAGHNTVIVDACNQNSIRRDQWKDPMWKREYVVMDVATDLCVERALAAGDQEIIPVINRMSTQWDLEGVFYGDEDYTPMAKHMQWPGKNSPQLYHQGSARD